MIKLTQLEYITNHYWKYKTFWQYIAENGNSVCVIGNNITTKEKGNEEFINIIKNAKKYNITRTNIEADNEGILERLHKSIDEYVEYIDNYKQYQEACKHNDEIRQIIRAFEKIA